MGKGTQHKGDWKETTLQVVIDARKLYCHSVKIMGNEKVFKPSNDFRDVTLIKISDTLLDVYVKCFDANRINAVKNPELAKTRLFMQQMAIVGCRRLLALFELAKPQFHIESRKFWNWMRMLVDFGKKLDAWHKSDMKRFNVAEEDLSNQDGRMLTTGAELSSAVC